MVIVVYLLNMSAPVFVCGSIHPLWYQIGSKDKIVRLARNTHSTEPLKALRLVPLRVFVAVVSLYSVHRLSL
jgi:hypothetical protein